eukprot:2883384-Rhodomonas_salina.1
MCIRDRKEQRGDKEGTKVAREGTETGTERMCTLRESALEISSSSEEEEAEEEEKFQEEESVRGKLAAHTVDGGSVFGYGYINPFDHQCTTTKCKNNVSCTASLLDPSSSNTPTCLHSFPSHLNSRDCRCLILDDQRLYAVHRHKVTWRPKCARQNLETCHRISPKKKKKGP